MGADGTIERPFARDTATFYAQYRRAYPAEFVARLRAMRGGGGRLLDLGCGTGVLLLQLAPFFDQAVGIDPEPDMLREAKKAAKEQASENVEWIRGSSADLQALATALGRFDLVTIGTAFHYMEPHATLGELQRIAPDGVVAVAYNGSPMWLHPDPWAKALRSVLESRLGQVFRNLIANAISFSPPGGTIRIAAERLGDFVRVSVEDEGPGIPEGKLEAIFDRFYTERPAGEKFGTHSGLGLSISKQIVEAHHGTIRAENRRDSQGRTVGARFVVLLPAA